ncbi:MAG: hypothetical protein II838_14765 [Lachnospiraceae bacterium]|nr:hypothetical protein [Lachnospiraceae bacterium]
MQTNVEELLKKYINNPTEGLTSKDIRSMSDEELLDMDYFMNEELDGRFWRRRVLYFLISSKIIRQVRPFFPYLTYV